VPDTEKLGVFYLGRRYDLEAGAAVEREPILYDAKDLTTHAVIVGMTGSGKTGLGVALLEEAALDGIPAIAIDPKGDLGNLLLAFPSLEAAEFRPWIDEAAAAREGRSADALAADAARRWSEGLAQWGQGPERVARYAAAAERAIYTPGSRAGRPLALLRAFTPPPARVAADAEALRERVLAAASGVLALLGQQSDPLRSREHILLSTLLERAWSAGQGLDLATLIQQVQRPPLERVGMMDLESFFPSAERVRFAVSLNHLAASPAFAAWTEGEPLEVARLLHAPDGRPRLSVVSIAHLSDAERMFFVTLLLAELVAWMRVQPGTPSLRAILYVDEVLGFLPPVANPPSKAPLLTLLKQARAFGLGVVLATQNPVDLDYKALSNAGTWFLGRLQTERDKARVIEGLEGTSVAAAGGFDRARTEATLAGLRSRVFLLHDVHEDAPVCFQTRFTLSYLAGPLTREQIRRLAAPGAPAAAEPAPAAVEPPARAAARARGHEPAAATRTPPPPGVAEGFVPTPMGVARPLYRPVLLGLAHLHYVHARARLDAWLDAAWMAPLTRESAASPWKAGREVGQAVPPLEAEPAPGALFAELPPAAARAEGFERWRKMLAAHLHRERPLRLWRSERPALVSDSHETEGDFRARVRDALREARDAEVETLRQRYARELARLRQQMERAEERVATERDQYAQRKVESAISIGATVVGALFGRKLGRASTLGRATTAARGLGRAAGEREDVARAAERASDLRTRLDELERRMAADVEAVEALPDAASLPLEALHVAPRRSDLEVEPLILVWMPESAPS
jgi:DNA helicase HerA-like ATPase